TPNVIGACGAWLVHGASIKVRPRRSAAATLAGARSCTRIGLRERCLILKWVKRRRDRRTPNDASGWLALGCGRLGSLAAGSVGLGWRGWGAIGGRSR